MINLKNKILKGKNIFIKVSLAKLNGDNKI